MPRYHIACCRTEYGYYFLDADDETQAKEFAQEKLVTGEEFDELFSTEVGIGDIKANPTRVKLETLKQGKPESEDEIEILEPAGFDEDIGELIHIPKEESQEG